MSQRILGRILLFTLLSAWILLQPETAKAHSVSFGYSHITLREDGIGYELLLLPDEMSPILNLDLDQDTTVSIEEAEQKRSDLQEFVARWLSIKADGADLQPKLGSIEMIEQGAGIPMIRLILDYNFGKKVNELVMKYDILFTESPTHHNFATITTVDGSMKEHNFDKNNKILKLYMNSNSPKAAVDRIIKIPAWIPLLLLLIVGAMITFWYFLRLRINRRNL